MDRTTTTEQTPLTSLSDSFERYLQDKGKDRGGDGGNYRRNAARELERFVEWTAGDRGDDDWTGIVPDGVDREPTFEDLKNGSFGSTPDISPVIGDSNKIPSKPTTAISLPGAAGVSTKDISRPTTRSEQARWPHFPRMTAESPATSRPGHPSSVTRSLATLTDRPATPSRRTRHSRRILPHSTSREPVIRH